MELIETKDFCDTIYTDDLVYMNEKCKKALNGLLNEGVSYSLAYYYNQAQKWDMAYFDSGKLKTRDYNFLVQALKNSDVIEMIDTKMYILRHTFQKLKDICMQSTIDYFASLLNTFIIVYVIFITLMITSIVYFLAYGFQHLKLTMWNTNLLLKIIPNHALTKKECE